MTVCVTCALSSFWTSHVSKAFILSSAECHLYQMPSMIQGAEDPDPKSAPCYTSTSINSLHQEQYKDQEQDGHTE